MDPALIYAGAQLIGGAINSAGQASANRQNLKIARETNAFNKAERQAQNQWNLDMWHKVNAYNTPLAQRKRFEEAGINPAMALSNMNAGQAQALTGATPAPGQGATMQNSMEGLSNGIVNGVNTYIQSKLASVNIRKLEADARREEIKNNVLSKREQAELDKIYADTVKIDADINRALFDLDLARKLAPHQVEEYAQRVKSIVTDTELKKVQTDLAKYQLKNVEPARLKELYANISSVYAHMKYLTIQGKMSEKQIEQMSSQIVLLEAQKLGVEASTKQVNTMIEPMVNQLKMQARYLDASTKYSDAKRDNISFENGMAIWSNTNGSINAAIGGMRSIQTGGMPGIY